MNIIPLTATPSQVVSVILGDQNCQITVEQKGDYLYLSLSINNSPIAVGIICRDRVALVRYPYLGFVGQLAFFDTMGDSDPVYTGLGSQYLLAYYP